MDFILENADLKLECTPKGGEILHLIDKKKNQEIIYQGNEAWTDSNPSLFPIIGSTYKKTYEINGKEYSMKNHGLIRYALLEGEKTDDTITFTYESSEATKQQYPFDFKYSITYRLENNTVQIAYRIENTGDVLMPFSFGLHPAFIVPQNDKERFEEYSIKFEKEEEANQIVFDSNPQIPAKVEPVHLNTWQLDRNEIKKYATIVYKDYSSTFVILKWKDEPRIKVSFPGFPFLAIWTHPTPSHFICIEPWYGHADFDTSCSDFYQREGTILLPAHEEFKTGYSIEIYQD